jgi:hypothetical protein
MSWQSLGEMKGHSNTFYDMPWGCSELQRLYRLVIALLKVCLIYERESSSLVALPQQTSDKLSLVSFHQSVGVDEYKTLD